MGKTMTGRGGRKGSPVAKGERKAPARARRTRNGRAAGGGAGGKKLVIVESPAKARTINRYLGGGFVVKASMGHVRDLPAKDFGVDLERDFAPTYEPLEGRGRKQVLAELRRYAKAAPEVFLATDLDREGEAIAWHLAELLKVPAGRVRRVIFNAITKQAIQAAFASPGQIDPNKVNAQQARRILDRIVGYKVSPLLWKKVARGLSAGRVQTVAVRLIVERERAIRAFVPEEFWKIAAVLTPDIPAAGTLAEKWAKFLAVAGANGSGPTQARQLEFLAAAGAFTAELAEWNGRKFNCTDAAAAEEIIAALGMEVERVERWTEPEAKGPAASRVKIVGRVRPDGGGAAYRVESIQTRSASRHPPGPFTTATLQQAAAVRLRYSATRTMRIAQQLYEGVEVPGEGSVGLITYMRTDSRNLSPQAVAQVRQFIGETFGPQYVPEKPNVYSSSARAQAAHEAIRPTDGARTPQSLAGALSAEQQRLYELIWRQFVACQMSDAQWQVTEVDVTARTPAGEGLFKAAGRQLLFDGYLRVAGMPRDDQMIPRLVKDQPVAPVWLDAAQKFTQPPPRYTEASLVKALEAEGIGRPSTYATIIQTIQDREYVRQTDRKFHATELGIVVTDKLVAHFADIFDIRFTARLEDQLDDVEAAKVDWVQVLREFYGPFKADLERAAEEMVHAKAETEPSDYTCPDCGKKMVYRWSKNGRYLACTGYPDCKTTCPVDEQGRKIERQTVDVACPKCSGALVLRRGRFGPFLSCSRYPDCDGVVNLDKNGRVKLPAAPPLKVEMPCPKCGAPLHVRRGVRGPWLACSAFPKCRGRVGFKTLPPDQQKQLELVLLNHEKANPQPVLRKLDGAPVEPGYSPRPAEAAEKS